MILKFGLQHCRDAKHCVSTMWDGLPRDKSLFFAAPDCGLPIGNLTSQLFSNVYLHDFDCFVKQELGVQYDGRYVDDFVLMHPDKPFLLEAKEKIRHYLSDKCGLTLHPKKIYFQHYAKGFVFLGAYLKPNRIYIGNRTKRNFFRAVQKTDRQLKIESGELKIENYLSCLHFQFSIFNF